jgi:hypothetical protein
VTWSANGGSITTSGLYTAGVTGGTFRVIATQQGGALADTSAVTLTAPAPVLQAVILTPATVTLAPNATQQFAVSGQWSNGATTAPSVTYTATGGTVSGNGLYTAGGSTGTFRVIATQQGGALADSSTITIGAAVPSTMYFNSSEPGGDGSNAAYLLTDDFEDGTWYSKNCDQANASGGLLQADGWCGTIYSAINPAGAAVPGGVRGTGYTATHGVSSGGAGGTNMADHTLAQAANEIYVRYYVRPSVGYQFGAEKFLTVNKDPAGVGGIYWGNLHINMGGNTSSTGQLFWQEPSGLDTSRNLGFTFTGNGHWYFIELHIKLSTTTTSRDGVLEVWADDVGADGFGGPATPTRRYSVSNYNFNRTSAGTLIQSLWFENWANPGSIGEMYVDQIIVSKSGPIGFMK